MPFFLTGLLTHDVERFGLLPVRGAFWKADLRTGTQDWSLYSFTGPTGLEAGGPCPEIVLEARSRAAAERAMSLIAAALIVVTGSNLFPIDVDLLDASSPATKDKGRRRQLSLTVSGIPEAVVLAARASWRVGRAYAIGKLYFSMVLNSTPLMDRHPQHSDTIPKSDDPLVHVRLAQAIVLAYGAVEELGLEIRASTKAPSSINGAWNPPVLADLESRLRRAGIDPYDSVLWDVRGRKTALERARPPRALRRAPWVRWPDVRDVNVALVDAIAHLSWLRSRVSAHAGNKNLVRVLSAYDVANAQQVARHLLLSSRWAGIFKLWFPVRRRRP